VRLKRQGEDWDMLEPLRARGSRPAVDETLANLMTAKIDREIVAKPEALGEFGLDKPAAEVTLTLKDGRTLASRWAPRRRPGCGSTRASGQAGRVRPGRERAARHHAAAGDFRDRAVLAFDPKAVTGFEVVLPDETLAVENTDGAWRLTRPTALRADNRDDRRVSRQAELPEGPRVRGREPDVARPLRTRAPDAADDPHRA